MWRLHNNMRAVRWVIVFFLAGLQLVMQAPVWFVFARVSIFSGSTGWHRSNLIDQTISHFSDWWLIGTKDTLSWGVWDGDITNHFILQGVRGGLITLVFFSATVILAFSLTGRALRVARLDSRRSRLFLWAIGATIFSHFVSFLNVSYFDQNIVNWYFSLAMVAAAAGVYCYRKQPALKRSVVAVTPGPHVFEESNTQVLSV